MRQPDKPQRRSFAIRENPLAYPHKLRALGFEETRQAFAMLHEAPPLMMPEIDPDAINTRQYPDTLNWPAGDRWKLMFQCSIYGSLSVSRSE
jgi:hypothetical protein